MFNDAKGFKRIYLAVGYTDLRKGIEGLATIVKQQFCLDPYEKGVLFLFCGRRTDRMVSFFCIRGFSQDPSAGQGQTGRRLPLPDSSTVC